MFRLFRSWLKTRTANLISGNEPDGEHRETRELKPLGNTASGSCCGGIRFQPFPGGFFLIMNNSLVTPAERHSTEHQTARFRSDRMEMVNLTIDQETFGLIASIAEEEGSSVSNLIRESFRSFLDAKDAKPSAPCRGFPTTPSLAHYLAAGRREFKAYAVKLAEVEQAADLDAGSLVEALLSGLPGSSPGELACWIGHGWSCAQTDEELEAALAPLFGRDSIAS
jgi:hypothetical protein